MFEKQKTIESNNAYEMSEREVRLLDAVRTFRRDPIEVLQWLKADILDENPESTTVVLKAIDEIEMIYVTAHEIDTAVNEEVDTEAGAFLATEKDSFEYYTILLELLHKAGYTAQEVLTWVQIESDTDSSRELLAERGLRAIFNTVYNASNNVT